MPVKIRVGKILSGFSKAKYNRRLGWISKIMNSNKKGEFEARRCVPSIYQDYYMSAEDYVGYLRVEYAYTRKNYFFVFFLSFFKIVWFFSSRA